MTFDMHDTVTTPVKNKSKYNCKNSIITQKTAEPDRVMLFFCCAYLAIQLGAVLSTSHVENNFMGTGLLPGDVEEAYALPEDFSAMIARQ